MQEIVYFLDQKTKIATLVFDSADQFNNTISERFITDFNEAVMRLYNDNVKGVILTSAKVDSFLEGVNPINVINNFSPLDFKYLFFKFQETLTCLATSSFPVVAFLNNQSALGSGFELILWVCDHVFATPSSCMGLPEIKVGLFPIMGGFITLKKLIGFQQSLDIIMQGKILSSEFFVQCQLTTIVNEKQGKEIAQQWLIDHSDQINRNYNAKWCEPNFLDNETCRILLEKACIRYAICPQKKYFRAAIDAFAITLDRPLEEATHQSIIMLASIIRDINVRNKIDLFCTTVNIASNLVRIDKKAALSIQKLAIIGAGLMGRGIAQLCAIAGIKILLIDLNKDIARIAKEKIQSEVAVLVNKGFYSIEQMHAIVNNISIITDYQELENVPLVIEAVFEELELKRKILNYVQQVNPNIIFATNTSTLPIAEISKNSPRPEQVVGMHYFSPVSRMPLLEVIEGPQTNPAVLATAVTLGRLQKKIVIVVGDSPGFYTSRTFGIYVMTGFLLAELGLDPWEVDKIAIEAGFPQGPLEVYGKAGGDVIYHAAQAIQLRNIDFPLPQTLINMYKARYIGGENHFSFYKGLEPDHSAQKFIAYNCSFLCPNRDEAKEMLILGMVNQAFLCLEKGILRDYYSMDVGAVLGIGFPDCWHGPARFVSQKGVKFIIKRLWSINKKFGLSHYKPSLELERLLACGVDKGII